jgi:putative protease
MVTSLPELLAPLNNWKSLSPITKVLEHADAVYFGLKTNFSMRARADNFAPEDLGKLMQEIHDHGKKGYLTTNIIIYDEELAELHQTIEWAKNCGVDAIICHDLSSIMLARELGMPFHISTQANISNKVAAKFYEAMGAERIILARELDLEQIKEIIASGLKTQVEVFVHGAMCTAISGRCYFSAEMMAEAPGVTDDYDEYSGNRGKCAQPCRRWWHLVGENGEKLEYDQASGLFFNSKDLCMIDHLPDLIATGVHSLKIEGRMRDPQYLMETVACYREALTAIATNNYTSAAIEGWVTRLGKVFNRGFHTGFYYHRPGIEDVQRTIRGNASPQHKVLIGKVTNYYRQIGVAEIELFTGVLKTGDRLILENRGDFFHIQAVDSIHLENEPVSITPNATADKHVKIAIKTDCPVPFNADVSRLE